jgi:hypothetical protein
VQDAVGCFVPSSNSPSVNLFMPLRFATHARRASDRPCDSAMTGVVWEQSILRANPPSNAEPREQEFPGFCIYERHSQSVSAQESPNVNNCWRGPQRLLTVFVSEGNSTCQLDHRRRRTSVGQDWQELAPVELRKIRLQS